MAIVFIVIALITVLMAIGTVTARNLFHAALFLVGAFFGVASLYATLDAGFLAAAQIIIYIGAIATLIIFAIMLSRSMMGREAGALNRQWIFAAAGALLLFVALAALVLTTTFNTTLLPVPDNAIYLIGAGFVGTYVIPFEVASILLVAALVGAIMLARERHR